MGSWGPDIFENDAALDWLGELEDNGDAARVAATLDRATVAPAEVLPEPAGSEALAAAELVAAARGVLLDDTVAPRLERFADAHAGLAALSHRALAAVEQVGTPGASELYARWHEGQDPDGEHEWDAALRALKRRLGA
jgi:hypothetical protein